MNFTEEQIERYSRHIILPEVGGQGQAKLLDSKVFVLGAGGLGSPILLYLAAAGVGTIGIADGACVDLSNLQRQIIHDTSSVIQAVEAVKELLGIGDTLAGHLLIFDALGMNFRKVKVRQDPECALCSEKATIKKLITYEEACEIQAAKCEA